MYIDTIDMDIEDSLVYYRGPFTEEVLIKFNRFLKGESSIPPRTTNKIFSVFVELAQNISKYSVESNHFKDEKGNGVGVFAIYREGENYIIKSGNLVEVETGHTLQQRCEELNQLDIEGLKEMRRSINSTPLPNNPRGGNIGLIQVSLKSKSKLRTTLMPTGNEKYVFFSISITLEPQDISVDTEKPLNGEHKLDSQPSATQLTSNEETSVDSSASGSESNTTPNNETNPHSLE